MNYRKEYSKVHFNFLELKKSNKKEVDTNANSDDNIGK